MYSCPILNDELPETFIVKYAQIGTKSGHEVTEHINKKRHENNKYYFALKEFVTVCKHSTLIGEQMLNQCVYCLITNCSLHIFNIQKKRGMNLT